MIISIWTLLGCRELATPTYPPTYVVPTLTYEPTPTETSTPLPTNSPTSTETQTPTQTNTPTATALVETLYPTPTQIGSIQFPYKTISIQLYKPRTSLKLRDCPLVDDYKCPYHNTYTGTDVMLIFCIWYNSIDDYWGSPDRDCYIRESETPTKWFALTLNGQPMSDPILAYP